MLKYPTAVQGGGGLHMRGSGVVRMEGGEEGRVREERRQGGERREEPCGEEGRRNRCGVGIRSGGAGKRSGGTCGMRRSGNAGRRGGGTNAGWGSEVAVREGGATARVG